MPTSIQLIHFSANAACRPLRDCLKRLGYSVSTLDARLGADAAPNPPWANAGAKVVFVPDSVGDSRPILHVLGTLRASRVLAVLERASDAWASSIPDQAYDFVSWPCDEHELSRRIGRISATVPPAALADEELIAEFAGSNLVGRCEVFLDVLRLIRRIADREVPVLIEGESGTGKELVARAFHYRGNRRDQPFIPLNCGGIPDSLFESELFGFERGTFTDAKASRAGLIEQAEGGTLFLDELEALSPRGQVSMLRFLQTHEFRALGSRDLRKADVRVIGATNSSLKELVARGVFREDLYYRLNVVTLTVPPLRVRATDIPILAEHFAQRFCSRYQLKARRLHASTLANMQEYGWPGNIRELENFVHRALLLSDGQVEIVADPAARVRPPRAHEGLPSFGSAKAEAIARFERSYLMVLLDETYGNVSAAAKRAGKERRALGRLIKKHGLCRESYERLGTSAFAKPS
jgi:DNA-binding NtrC family response regulator